MCHHQTVRDLEGILIELKMELALVKSSKDHLKFELSKLKSSLDQVKSENEDLRAELARTIEKDQNSTSSTNAAGVTKEIKTNDNNKCYNKRLTHGMASCASGVNLMILGRGFSSSKSLESEGSPQAKVRYVSTKVEVKTNNACKSSNKWLTHGIASCASGIEFLATISPSPSRLFFTDSTLMTNKLSRPRLPDAPSCASFFALIRHFVSSSTLSVLSNRDDNSFIGSDVENEAQCEGTGSTNGEWDFFEEIDS